MPRINLRPWREERRQERQKQFIVVAVTVAVVSVVVALGTYQFFESLIKTQNKRNAFITQEMQKFDQQIDEIQKLQKKKADLLERMRVIQNLQGNRPIIVQMFDQLVKTLPEGLFYTKIERKADVLTIVGVAESNNRVSNLMRNLNNSDWFKDPNLVGVSASPEFDGEGVKFDLTVKLTTPEDKRKSAALEAQEGGSL